MKLQRKTTIFKQLILNVIIPVVIALLILAGLNYFSTKNLLFESNENRNEMISKEIKNILEFQDVAFDLVESRLDNRMRDYSNQLVNKYFANTENIDLANLHQIREEIGMIPDLEDIYIIDRNGTIVNTTFEKDLNLNLFKFGEGFKKYLLEILVGDSYKSERFTIEMSTKRIKKYTYQPTNDHKYLIQIGVYSKKADDIIDFIKSILHELAYNQESIKSVDLFIGADNPFSLDQDAIIIEEHDSLLRDIFIKKTNTSFDDNLNDIELHYDYIYMDRKKTDLYKGAAIRIISDRSHEVAELRKELIKSIIILILALLAVTYTIYSKTKVITSPIKKLLDNVIRITAGDMSERATVEGRNEIATLSMQFNKMIEELESYYHELEEKVKERTAEITRQKEKIEVAYHEIEEQKKNITDSIRYAQRIQEAILPPDDQIRLLMPDGFVLYKPKDIVSGDFYWISAKDDKVIFIAADCTGHGVPGAFMSMIGASLINEVINDRKILKPSMMLDALRDEVIKALKQTGALGEQKDGMDMAICVIDMKSKILEFAGANNPLYIFRDDIAKSDLVKIERFQTFGENMGKIKADKQPVGIYEEIKPFTNHTIQLQKGDTIYIFTDGFYDQFGGPKGKKFKSRQFKELLVANQDKNMGEQKAILDTSIEAWRGNNEQTDDILVIGLKI